MKNRIIKTTLLGLFIVLGLSSCDKQQKTDLYNINEPVKYSFLQKAIGDELTTEYNGKIPFTITRTNPQGTSTVDIKFTASAAVSALFSLGTPALTFQDGSYSAQGYVSFDLNRLAVDGTQYAFTLSFADAELPILPNAKNDKNVNTSSYTTSSVSRKLTYQAIGTGYCWEAAYTAGFGSAIKIEQAVEDPTVYRFKDFYSDSQYFLFTYNASTGAATVPLQTLGDAFKVSGHPFAVRCLVGSYNAVTKKIEFGNNPLNTQGVILNGTYAIQAWGSPLYKITLPADYNP